MTTTTDVLRILAQLDAEQEALRRELPPELWARVDHFADLSRSYERLNIVETIARHLPGLAPAVRALALHAENDEDDCCGAPA